MSEENETTTLQRMIEVHDILIMKTVYSRRIWLVTGSLVGGYDSESLFQLRPLDEDVGSDVDGRKHESLVPMEILWTLLHAGNLEIIHRP